VCDADLGKISTVSLSNTTCLGFRWARPLRVLQGEPTSCVESSLHCFDVVANALDLDLMTILSTMKTALLVFLLLPLAFASSVVRLARRSGGDPVQSGLKLGKTLVVASFLFAGPVPLTTTAAAAAAAEDPASRPIDDTCDASNKIAAGPAEGAATEPTAMVDGVDDHRSSRLRKLVETYRRTRSSNVMEIVLEMERSYRQAHDTIVNHAVERSFVGTLMPFTDVCDYRHNVPRTCLLAESLAVRLYCRWSKEMLVTAVEEMSIKLESERGAALVRLCEARRSALAIDVRLSPKPSAAELFASFITAPIKAVAVTILAIVEIDTTLLACMFVCAKGIAELVLVDEGQDDTIIVLLLLMPSLPLLVKKKIGKLLIFLMLAASIRPWLVM
jgi:hypothetical protein